MKVKVKVKVFFVLCISFFYVCNGNTGDDPSRSKCAQTEPGAGGRQSNEKAIPSVFPLYLYLCI